MVKRGRIRLTVQAIAAMLQNANFKGFFSGKIYDGPTKSVCVPGLNCYSCPGAVGACPIGSLQNFLSGIKVRFPYYVLGLLFFFGALLGRAVCGFLCPFGLLQDLLDRIPFPVKKNHFKAHHVLKYLKYVVLVVCVVILPIFLKLTPFFCKYICPSGTLSGILLAAANSGVASKLGKIFTWKLSILIVIVVSSLAIYRPFCKYLCPLGAFYGMFNRFAAVRMECDRDRCVSCGKCAQICKMCVDPSVNPNSAECIRCGECIRECPVGALSQNIAYQQNHSRKIQREES